MLQILSSPESIIGLIFTVFAMVISIITFIRTGNLNKSLLNFMEVYNLKYKTFETSQEVEHSQIFTPYRDKYVLNPDTNEIEKLPVPENVQEYIQSYVESCLERSLDKYLPKGVIDDDAVADYTQSCEDLAAIGDAMEIAEEYREAYNLPDNYSMAQIYEFVDKKAVELKNKIGVVTKQLNEKKEENENNGKS